MNVLPVQRQIATAAIRRRFHLARLAGVGLMSWLVWSNASATTAKEWLALSADEQRGFVSGTMEAYAYAGSIALSAGQTRLGDFLLQPLNCIVSLNLGSPAKEVHALVLRYVKAHSETAGQDAARVVRGAVLASCDKAGTK